MSKFEKNILIVEPSFIVFEGVVNIIKKLDQVFNIRKVDSLVDIEDFNRHEQIDLIILNPSIIQNQIKAFNLLKKELAGTQWIGLVYSFFDNQITSLFDGIITINDNPALITNTINSVLNSTHPVDHNQDLSEREIDVLKLLVSGNSNKEIADKLYLSVHTVISHRKNISQKTGIKSVAGLTIYAVVNKIISLENFTE